MAKSFYAVDVKEERVDQIKDRGDILFKNRLLV